MKPNNEKSNIASLIFVYGSLKRGFSLHHYLADHTFIGTAQTLPLYRLFDCGEYPALVDAATDGQCVKGEVYRVSKACQLQLDEVEGVDEGLYERREIRLATPYEDASVQAWFYLHPVAGLKDCGQEWP